MTGGGSDRGRPAEAAASGTAAGPTPPATRSRSSALHANPAPAVPAITCAHQPGPVDGCCWQCVSAVARRMSEPDRPQWGLSNPPQQGAAAGVPGSLQPWSSMPSHLAPRIVDKPDPAGSTGQPPGAALAAALQAPNRPGRAASPDSDDGGQLGQMPGSVSPTPSLGELWTGAQEPPELPDLRAFWPALSE
ncbi:hypothetical protein DFJ74DRAFT_399436 [Hyaloraphidium curvatum]|nr:hypothetical protein DFJ74DRAFT_399436 [Hyaloraphidium curvatum]